MTWWTWEKSPPRRRRFAIRKEALARQVAERDSIDRGLIAVFKTIEPCQSHALRRKADGGGFEFRLELRKCLQFYFYFERERFGFMHVQLQSWFPFEVDICQSIARHIRRVNGLRAVGKNQGGTPVFAKRLSGGFSGAETGPGIRWIPGWREAGFNCQCGSISQCGMTSGCILTAHSGAGNTAGFAPRRRRVSIPRRWR